MSQLRAIEMSAKKSKTTKKHGKYRALRLIVLGCAVQAIGLLLFINWFENGFSQHCEDVTEIKHGELIQREIVKATEEKSERVLKLLSTLSREDRVTGREREKWSKQIESSTLRYIANLKQTKPDSISPHSFVKYQTTNLSSKLAGFESENNATEDASLHWSLKRVSRPVAPIGCN